MATNLAYFFETAKKVRGGRWVWVKDGNGEDRRNILLGGTIANPNKGFGHLWAAQLMEYTPGQAIKIFRSFAVSRASQAAATTIYIKGDGYSDAPEIGQVIMLAPDDVTTQAQSAKITGVTYDETNAEFTVTIDTAIGELAIDDILVEATGTAASATATVLCPNPNIFNEADRDLMPTEGFGMQNANYSVSGVYDKQAWIAKMQPLPKYVLAKNRSYIEGIFWI